MLPPGLPDAEYRDHQIKRARQGHRYQRFASDATFAQQMRKTISARVKFGVGQRLFTEDHCGGFGRTPGLILQQLGQRCARPIQGRADAPPRLCGCQRDPADDLIEIARELGEYDCESFGQRRSGVAVHLSSVVLELQRQSIAGGTTIRVNG